LLDDFKKNQEPTKNYKINYLIKYFNIELIEKKI